MSKKNIEIKNTSDEIITTSDNKDRSDTTTSSICDEIIDVVESATKAVYKPSTQDAALKIQGFLPSEQDKESHDIHYLDILLEPGPGIYTPSYAESLRSSLLDRAKQDPKQRIIPIILPVRFRKTDPRKRFIDIGTNEEFEDLRSQIIHNIQDCATNLGISLGESSEDSNNPLILLQQLKQKVSTLDINAQIIFILPEVGQDRSSIEQENDRKETLPTDIRTLYVAARVLDTDCLRGKLPETLCNTTSIRIVDCKIDPQIHNFRDFSHFLSYTDGLKTVDAFSSVEERSNFFHTIISQIVSKLGDSYRVKAIYLLELLFQEADYDIPKVISMLKIIQDEYPDIFEKVGSKKVGSTIDSEPDANAYDPEPRKSSEQQIIEAIHTRLLEEKIGFSFESLKHFLYLRSHYNDFGEFGDMLDKHREDLREVYCFALLFGKLFDQDKSKRKILFEPILIEMIARIGLIRKKVYSRYEGTDLFQNPKAIEYIVRIALGNKSAEDQDKRDIANKLIPDVRKEEYRELILKLLPVFFALWILEDKKDDLGNNFPEDYINSSRDEEELDYYTDILSKETTLLDYLLAILKAVKKGTDYKIKKTERIPRTSIYGQLVISFAGVVGINIENYPQLANMFRE